MYDLTVAIKSWMGQLWVTYSCPNDDLGKLSFDPEDFPVVNQPKHYNTHHHIFQGPYSLTVLTWDLTWDFTWTRTESHLRLGPGLNQVVFRKKIIATRLSRDLTHDVSVISRRCLVCVTFFHSKSMATIVTSSRIHDSNIVDHGCAGREVATSKTRMTRLIHSSIYSITQSRLYIYTFGKTCQHVHFVSMTVTSCICRTKNSLDVIFQGESRCKSPSSRSAPWLTPRLGSCLQSRLVSD